MKFNPKVDFYFRKAGKWQAELEKLRTIILDCGLTEELKWGVPCYTAGKGNVVLIHAFKDYCAMLFVKGALLTDPEGILVQQTENVQGGRQIRFSALRDIVAMERTLKAYVHEAVEIEKAGLKVALKNVADFDMPEEFGKKLDEMPALRTAFEALTPGRQRAYLLHFGSARQAKTREARIEKYIPYILDGKGMDD
ncbi:MAG: YdeI/OmpD-associated family protein ['Candidatus Kapabacteria' thiocyanatum]|uniref:YdhG-like domain-containing protein n=1 Tax=Candidatus Kapaibacterium thiocyanatum TaxID=1895771 RepID=A0A1M3L3N0_9BACT|nr:YdeI/OmpD-associated family protein ['Candidatus Kapabacteria' thiocyanatum]OJX59959.1 MAG: hypothetical protein BGO89_08170 ['Candidatus Kapabacteria' thiocyanatum]